MTRQGIKKVRMAVQLVILAAVAGIVLFPILKRRLGEVSAISGTDEAGARSEFSDLEGVISGALEPIGALQLKPERREVLADDSVGGAPILATVRLGGLPRAIYPDANGVFPSVDVSARQRVEVKLRYLEGITGEAVQVQTQDGGVLDKNETARILSLNERGECTFWFEASVNEGTHRVTVRRGFDEKTFDFWVGTKPAMHVVRSLEAKAGR